MDASADVFKLIRDPKTKLRDVKNILPPNKLANHELLLQCRMELTRKIAAIDWEDTRVEQQAAEVESLFHLIKNYGELMVDEQLVTSLFLSKNFMLPVGDITLGLLNYLINLPVQMPELPEGFDIPEGFGLDEKRSLSQHLQRAVGSWATRLFKVENKIGENTDKKTKRGGLLSNLARGGRGLFGLTGNDEDIEGLEEQRLPQVLTQTINWWIANCTRLRGEKNVHIAELEWVIFAQLTTFCLSGPLFARETIQNIKIATDLQNKMPPELQRPYVDVLCSCVKLISPFDVIKAIYPDPKELAAKYISKMQPWKRDILRRIMEKVIDNLLHSESYQLKKKEKMRFELSILLRSGAVWPFYMYWYTQQELSVRKYEQLTEGQLIHWERLEKYFLVARDAFERGFTTMVEGTCPISDIKACIAVKPTEIMKNCWDCLNMSGAIEETQKLYAEIESQWEVLQKLKIIAEQYLQNSKTQKQILDSEKLWNSLQIREMRVLFRTLQSDKDWKLRFEEFDENFLNAWPWLFSLVESKLFQLIWSEISGADTVAKLVPASKKFKKEYANLLNESTTFKRMKSIAPILNLREERKYFCNAAPGFSSGKGTNSGPSWKIVASKKKTKTDLRILMHDWLHLYAVHQNISGIIRVLDCLHLFIKATGIKTLDEAKNSAAAISTVFQKENFDDKQVKEIGRFVPNSSKLDPCLVRLSPELFEAIVQCMSVLDWLRELPDDNDFTSSIEEAMGKSEMECPVELWQEQEGKPGRVDEQKLSMLNTVRGYLHDLIFRQSDRLDDLASLIKILAELRATDENIINSLITANQYRIPLRELLDAQSENGAPDRLLQLLLPVRKTKWICRTESDMSTEGSIWLIWEVSRGGAVTEKKQNLNELMDFQSSIVLAKTDQRGPDTQLAIEQFIQQFGWIRMLNENLTALLQAGHFEFQKFDISYSFNENPSVIRNKVMECKDILDTWISEVESQRNSNYFLNFYSMKHVWKLVSTIRSIKPNQINDLDDTPIYTTMRDILCLINPDSAQGGSDVIDFIQNFYKRWIKDEPSSSNNKNYLPALEALKLCGKCLEETLKKTEIRFRPVNIPDVSNYSAGADIHKGLNILCADNSNLVYDHILSGYARAGYLPERELVYVCRPTTTWDDVYTLLLRWARSHQNGRNNKFYCLASIEYISFEIQRKAATIIREHVSTAKNPLLVISGNADKQYLVAQFAHCRTSVIPLPEEILQKFSKEIETNYSQGIGAYVSNYAGSGKTFAIRRKAASLQSNLVPVAIMNSQLVLDKILTGIKKRNLNNEMDFITLHLDIYDTAKESLNPLIFDLIFLGGIEDSTTGQQYFWNADNASIYIEVATGSLIERVRICALLPQNEVSVSGKSFCVSKKALHEGMLEEFSTLRNDGTAMASDTTISVELNAFERLQYVCIGLDIMDNNKGRFPFVMERNGKSIIDSLRESSTQEYINRSTSDKLTSERCFKLLSDCLELEKPSLWCIWSFINVFYWQLRDMHHPESPINCACMPDPNAVRKGDVQTKAAFKGEVVKFLIRTAREFATRQIKEEDTMRTKGVYVTGMSRQEFNGLWERMECENDGKPAFQKRSSFGHKNFIYFRKEENAWVIDDVIDPTGPVYSRCQTGTNMDGVWSTTPEWCENPKIKVEKITNKKGHNGEAIRVSGCEDGGSLSVKENGVYLRQPPYDDINKNPHYIRIIDEKKSERRHIFVGNDHGWQICPICTDEEGTYCMSTSKNITGRWRSIPPDKVEDKARFQLLNEEEYPDYVRKPAVSYARSEIRDRAKEAAEAASLRESLQRSGLHVNENENEDGEETMEQLWDNTLKWNDSNHECVLFSNISHVVSFLSLDPEKLRSGMHPGLLNHLKKNGINVGEDLDQLSPKFYEILAALTEVKKTEEEAKNIMGGKYCLTGDSLLKMLAIFARLRCGVPVVLMGECGCGKTMLVKYLCSWMSVKLLILDVHGGTSEDDIIRIFNRASNAIKNGEKKIFIFLDEINTCAHMGLLCEVICHRSIYGERIPEEIFILAALNPYRRRPDQDGVPGLVFQLPASGSSANSNAPPDPMAQLVYRVHPIPHTLRDFIFDFGALTPTNEKTYIISMVRDKHPTASQFIIEHIGNLIHFSQQYIRKTEKDDSSASLRDVRRCLNLTEWFLDIIDYSGENPKLSPLACATTLSLAFVYYFRLSTAEQRENYWKRLGTGNAEIQWRAREIEDAGFSPLRADGAFVKLIQHFQKFIGSHVLVEDGIAMNDALMENLFVVIICILTRIPIFVVGKPGSSKTLTLQVIASNLQGKQSPMEFWRKYPAVYIFPYQCSPMSDSHSIQHQFDMAVRYQEHAENTITVLLLDEVGLAEHSPDMPLKVLHAMLVDPPISVVGLSNWVLDPAKMNRAILLQRTEPSKGDIQLTGKSIVSSGKGGSASGSSVLDKYLQPLAEAYHKIYTQQKGRDFVGMRDYYNLVKLLRGELTKQGRKAKFTGDLLTFGLARNFGGKRDLMNDVFNSFHTACFGNVKNLIIPDVTNLIRENLTDPMARHLMLLTKNSSALPLMFGCGLLDERTTKVLVGSEFKDDRTELHLITQINEVKLAMAEGSRLVLLNHDNIYEALYDVLNQRYLFKKDNQGNIKKMLRLAIGSRSQLCNVADGFKIVVIVEQDHAYRNLDLPLLNRFEKQVLCGEDVLGVNQKQVVNEITKWCEQILDATGLTSMQDVFCGFHPGTIPSAVLNVTNFDDSKVDSSTSNILKTWLTQVTRPIAVMNSEILKSFVPNYFKEHSCLTSLLEKYVYPSSSTSSFSSSDSSEFGSMCVTLTHSPISHLEETIDKTPLKCSHSVLQLGELTSERQLYSHLKEFFQKSQGDENILIIQCDPIACRQSLINHARYVCVKERSQYEFDHRNDMIKNKRHILFLVHLPPGTKQRSRFFALDFISPWTYLFVDDLRREEASGDSNTVALMTNSVYDLIEKGAIPMRKIYQSRFQHALSTCVTPDVNTEAAYFGKRIETLQKLIQNVPTFIEFVESTMMLILESTKSFVHISGKENTAKVPSHVRMVCEDLMGGSLRQSLDLAIQTIIIQAFAHVLRSLDCNFNLATVWQSGREDLSFNLWFNLLSCDAIVDKQAIANKASVGKDSFVRSENVENTGIFEALVSRFPFSYRIIPLLNSDSTRDQVEKVKADPKATIDNLAPSLFGSEVVNAWQKLGNNNHVDYLHDFVATSTYPIPGSSFNQVYRLYEHILRITRPDSLQSPGGIHSSVWENETRLFRCCSLLANNRVPLSIRNGILSSIESITPPALNNCDISTDGIRNRLAELDFCVLYNLLSNYWDRVKSSELYDSFYAISSFIHEFSSIRSDIELYILSLSSYKDKTMYRDVTLRKIQDSFLGLRVVHLYLQEIMYNLLLRDIEEVKGKSPKDIIKLSENIEMSSIPFLKNLISAYHSHIPGDFKFLGISFLRRYLQEIVFGEQEGFYNISSNHVVPLDFCNALESIFADRPSEKQFVTLTKNLSLRRALLHCLIQCSHQLKLEGTEAQQFYLQYHADNLSDIKNWRNKNLFSSNDIQLGCSANAGKISNKKDYLECLAKLQMCLFEYAKIILTNDGTESLSAFMFKELEILLKKGGYHPPVYALKCIKCIGGIDNLAQAIQSPEQFDWMPLDRSMAAKSKISLPDPFMWLTDKEKYEQVCGAVRSCVTQSSKQTLQLDKLKFNEISHDIFGGCIFSQISVERNIVFAKGTQALKKWFSEKLSSKTEILFFDWLASQCPNFDKRLSIDRLDSMCHLQIGVNLALWSLMNVDSWLYGLFFEPNAHAKSFLISIPDDEFAEVVKASGRVGWYICPNGHKYSVGQCTMPMQKARCPACGAEIGGSNHTSVRGVRRLDDGEIRGDPDTGYAISSNESDAIRMSPLASRTLRFILHLSLLMSCSLNENTNASIIAKVLSPEKKVDPFEFLSTRISQDWKKLKNSTGLGDGDLTLGLHLALRQLRQESQLAKGCTITSSVTRNREETKIANVVERIFSDRNLKSRLESTRTALQDDNTMSSIRLATGEKLWYEIHEEQYSAKENPDLTTLLWRFREPVSFDHFKTFWRLQAPDIKNKYSLLRTLLQEEEKLPSIRGVSDVLAWHSILFEIIPHMSITRVDSIEMKNKDVIAKLPVDRQKHALEIFQRFAKIFNLVLPTIELLFECNKNPFIKDGAINLGEPAEMSLDTPVAFSLPSMVTGTDGGDFINGMCTIRILEILVDAQNEVLEAIEESGKRKKGGWKKFPGAPNAPPQPAPVEAEREAPQVPAVNYRTPSSILQNQLVVYDREKDLLPLLRMFADQPLTYGCGGELSYNLDMVESALANGLLAGKRAVNLCISHYQYAGDVKRMGHLPMLKKKLPQESQMPASFKEAISIEIDTQNRALRLMQILEICIQFIISVGSSSTANFDGRTLLSSYVLNTIHIPKEEWEQVSTPTIQQQICLRNIEALYLLLESQVNGNPLDDVLDIYREELTQEQENALLSAAPKMDVPDLLTELRDFLVNQLTKASQQPTDNLKETIGWVGLNEEDWWVHFPEGPTIANAKAVYNTLASLV